VEILGIHDSRILRLKEGLRLLGISIDHETIYQLYRYSELILEWNRKIALISKGDEDIIEKHILDSLSIYSFIKGKKLLDFGSGAGLPGIPLKILNRNISLDIIERRKKKALFLREVKRELKLTGVRIHPQDITTLNLDNTYNIITVRKVGPIKDVLKRTERFLEKDGRIITFKGERLALELKETERLMQKQSLCVAGIEDRLFFNGKIVIIERRNS